MNFFRFFYFRASSHFLLLIFLRFLRAFRLETCVYPSVESEFFAYAANGLKPPATTLRISESDLQFPTDLNLGQALLKSVTHPASAVRIKNNF